MRVGRAQLDAAFGATGEDETLTRAMQQAQAAAKRAVVAAAPHIEALLRHWEPRQPDWIQYPDGDIVRNSTPGTMVATLEIE